MLSEKLTTPTRANTYLLTMTISTVAAIATITAHMERVAELDAKLLCGEIQAAAVALAKVALETEHVRLDALLEQEILETEIHDTWTSHIKTLEWMLKFSTMLPTFKTFKRVLTDATVELVQLFLKLTDIDPTAEDNFAIRFASRYGHTEVVKVLNACVDPSAENNSAICLASMHGHANVVKVLLADARVDPSASDNFAICEASMRGHLDVVKVLLADARVDPSADHNSAIRLASENGHTDVVKVLLADPRVDPSAATINAATKNRHLDVVKMLLADARVDPSPALCLASMHGHANTVKMLLAHPRVDPSIDRVFLLFVVDQHSHRDQADDDNSREELTDVVKMLLADPRIVPKAVAHTYNLRSRS